MDVLLVGGAGGIGSAAAHYLAERGIRVFSCDVTNQKAHKNIVPYITDISDQKSIDRTYQKIASVTTELSAIISLAGIYFMDSFIEITEEKLCRIVEVNLMGVYRINKTFLPLLKKDGRIIITTSELAGQKPLPFNGMYAMTKTALQCYADSLRLELALVGIKVINIKPGPFDTGMVASTNGQAEQMAAQTKLYKIGMNKFITIMQSKTNTAKDPGILAKVYYKALTSKHPRLTYSKNAGLGLKLYSVLPRRLQMSIIKWILK